MGAGKPHHTLLSQVHIGLRRSVESSSPYRCSPQKRALTDPILWRCCGRFPVPHVGWFPPLDTIKVIILVVAP